MYRDFYGLVLDPFGMDPNLDFLFISRAHEEAVSHIAYGLEQHEPIILITGDIGTGKTVALQRVIAQLSGVFVPVLINVTTIDFAQFMRLVMFKLGSPEPPHDISGLLHEFEAKIIECRDAGRKVLLVVDEAQNCSTVLLESVRLLLNMAQPGGQALQLVLAGQIGLEDVLAQPDLRQFRQRIRVSYRLECLTRQETEAYAIHRLKVAGRDSPLFEPGALDRIFELSGGVPRLVNQLADRALLAGFVENAKRIKSSHVEDVSGPAPSQIHEESSSPGAEPAPAASSPARDPVAKHAEREPASPRLFAERKRVRSTRRNAVMIGAAVVICVAVLVLFRFEMFGRLLRHSAGIDDSQLPALARPAEGSNDAAVVADAAATVDTALVAVPGEVPQDTSASREPQPAVQSAEAPKPAVQVAPPNTATEVVASPQAATSSVEPTPVSVHVFSFRTPDRAENSRGRLERAGMKTFILKEAGASGQSWYRVYVGPVAGAERAATIVDSLRAGGLIEYAAITHKMPLTP